MRAASTSSPSARRRASASAPEARPNRLGTALHSACHAPAGRSCAATIEASMVATCPGAVAAAERMIVAETGLRLCGMAVDPPRPGTCGSATSATSVEARLATSPAILPSAPIRIASQLAASAIAARRVCQAMEGAASRSSAANASSTAGPCWPIAASVPTGPPSDAPRTFARTSRLARASSRDARQPDRGLEAERDRRCVLAIGPPRARRRAVRPGHRDQASENAIRSACSSSKASRICSTSAVSTMSCVVAPLWNAASSSAGRRFWTAFTNGIVGTPASAVAASQLRRDPGYRARSPRWPRPALGGASPSPRLRAGQGGFRAQHRGQPRPVREHGAHPLGREERTGQAGIERRKGHAAPETPCFGRHVHLARKRPGISAARGSCQHLSRPPAGLHLAGSMLKPRKTTVSPRRPGAGCRNDMSVPPPPATCRAISVSRPASSGTSARTGSCAVEASSGK